MTGRGTPYQTSQRTEREAARILDDLSSIDVPGATVVERGSTYLVFGPRRRRLYGPGRAVALAVMIALAVLVAGSVSVVLIALLPFSLLPFVPLLLDETPLIAVGAVEDDVGGTRVTVHGHAWGALGPALDAYLDHLPEAPPPVHDDADNGYGARPGDDHALGAAVRATAAPAAQPDDRAPL